MSRLAGQDRRGEPAPGRPEAPGGAGSGGLAWLLLVPLACCLGPLVLAGLAAAGAWAWGGLGAGAAVAAAGALVVVRRRRAGCRP